MGYMKAIRSGTRSTKNTKNKPTIEVEDVVDDDEEPDLGPPRSHVETAKNHQVA
jgi:hypothetical protein